ncbi:MAG: hypothetical protein K6G61_08080 [Solobacterium sp.]|nr:hypothetical protein [Solobacterium sp.]
MNSIHINGIKESADAFRSLSASAAELADEIRKASYEAESNEITLLGRAAATLEKYAEHAQRFAEASDKACAAYLETERKIIAVYNEEVMLYPKTLFARSHFEQLEEQKELLQISSR